MKKKLLVVDPIGSTYSLFSQSSGIDFEIIHKIDGYEALEFLYSGIDIDLLITNLDLPQLTAKDLTLKLRSSYLFSQIPILVVTPPVDSSTRIDCINSGVDTIVEMPFNPLEFYARINALYRLCHKRKGMN